MEVLQKKFGTPINHLRAINNISGSKILVGQKLRVTQKSYYSSKSKEVYRVRTGDTLSKISGKFNIRISTLKSTMISMEIRYLWAISKFKTKRFPPCSEWKSLGSISRRYGTSIRELEKRISFDLVLSILGKC